MPGVLDDLTDAFGDLVVGARCLGCERPGRLLCRSCAVGLDPHPAPAWPWPVPSGLTAPWAATTYAGTVRAMILGHKERRLMALAQPLGALLALAVAAAVEDAARAVPPASRVPLLLVPVPSRPVTVRRRGYEPTASLVGAAAAVLPALGWPARCVSLLRTRPGVADQSGLDAGARAANLAGAFRAHPPALRGLARAGRPWHVVVCDDVLTTGSTAAEAQRALRAVGLPPVAVVAVAATRRRTPCPDRDVPVPRSPATG